MALAQKFRGFITSTAPAAALATLLTVIPAFNNNATAQEPALLKPSTSAAATLTSHHNSSAVSPHFTHAESPFESAKPDAKTNKRVAFWLMLPQEGRYTPEAAGEILVGQMAKRGVIKQGEVNAHSYGTNSPKDGEMKVIVYIGDKVYVSPLTGTSVFDLRSIIPQLDTIAEQYQEIQPSGRVATNKTGPVESTP
jgi:hypothetical protein